MAEIEQATAAPGERRRVRPDVFFDPVKKIGRETVYVCRTCGAYVAFDLCHRHAKSHGGRLGAV